MVEHVPEPPGGLGEPGVRLWTSIAGEFVLNAGEVEILRQAVATADEIASLEAELRASALVVAGYSGQPRPNPLLKIIQDHRLLLRRLVDSLALPDADEEWGLRPGQRHAQKAAQGRWRAKVPTDADGEPVGKLAELRAAAGQGGW